MSAIPRPLDVDAEEDYLQYSEELQRHPEYSPVHRSQAFAQHHHDDAQSPSSDAYSQSNSRLSIGDLCLVEPSNSRFENVLWSLM
ncbi:hypothetical protein PIB30_069632, partial [Stylosanthes scabra]|nr:hypothetical protein [Stylosanthes scabra]